MKNLQKLKESLEIKIQNTYETGVTVLEAEKLSAEFLNAMLMVSGRLTTVSLDARMKKSGVRAVRSAVLLDEISKVEKKPTESVLSAILDSNEIVASSQKELDLAEVEVEELKRLYDIYNNCHIFYRTITKGLGSL